MLQDEHSRNKQRILSRPVRPVRTILPPVYVVCRKVIFSVVSVCLSFCLFIGGSTRPVQFCSLVDPSPNPVGKRSFGPRLKNLLVKQFAFGEMLDS